MKVSHSRRDGICRLPAIVAAAAAFSLTTGAWAAFAVTTPNSAWTPAFPSTANDYFADQQTGQGQSDLVGNTSHSHLLWHFDAGSTTSNTDGTLFFRARLGGKDRTSSWPFDNVLIVGLDFANPTYGKMDLFIVVNAGVQSGISVHGAGFGANNSPASTTIGKSLAAVRGHNATNYNFSYVNSALDDTSADPIVDLDSNLAPDGYVSFSIPFSDVVAAAATPATKRNGGTFLTIPDPTKQGGPGLTITDTTPISFAVGTSTQPNAFNQDVAGVGKSGMDSYWSTFATPAIAPTELNTVPEPAAVAVVAGVALMGLRVRRRERLPLAVKR